MVLVKFEDHHLARCFPFCEFFSCYCSLIQTAFLDLDF
uniref:Uncharacterized protein n=1 Tax=Rhizophora mucronata TaxID=61149 RepID=A0A2P2QSZ2_RHIMU